MSSLRCTLELIRGFLGYVPGPADPPIIIPESRVIAARVEHGNHAVNFAANCAKSKRIKFVVEKGR